MNEISIENLEELSILDFKNKNKLKSIYNSALGNTSLSIIDYMTIRDILNLSGYDDLSLHVMLICMFISLSKGSICIKIDEKSLQSNISTFYNNETESIVKSIIAKIEKYPELIYYKSPQEELFHDNQNEFKPLVMLRNDKTKLLYFQKYYHAEQKLKLKLLDLIRHNYFDKIDVEKLKKIIHEILNENPILFDESPAKFNKEQVLAMIVPVFHNLSIISGGPGTGKTSIIINLVRIFVRLGISIEKIKITAPTGRAAQKISDSILKNIGSINNANDVDSEIENVATSTIHRLLKFEPASNNFYYNSKNKIDADILIIDEISMVDAILLSKMLTAVGDETRVIFLGDRNQLPSIEAGAILADLIPDESKISYSKEFAELSSVILQKPVEEIYPVSFEHNSFFQNMVVLLHENFRSEKSIQKISEEINIDNTSSIDRIPVLPRKEFQKDSISFEDCDVIKWSALGKDNKYNGVYKIIQQNSSIFEIHSILSSWINHQYLNKSIHNENYVNLVSEIKKFNLNKIIDERAKEILNILFTFIDNSKILSPLNTGLTGTSGINTFIIKTFKRKFDPQAVGETFSGLPIMIRKNDYDKNLFNGDTGIILKQKDNQYYGIFMRSGEFISYPLEMLNSYMPAFAITVHKSQGSEYNEVLFVIPDSTPDKMISREIIYTGVTRAKDFLVLYSTDDKLKTGIMKKIERESGIIFEH